MQATENDSIEKRYLTDREKIFSYLNIHKSQVLMTPFQSPQDYLFNLQTTSKSDAKRLWRKQIKESWNHKCAYCESEDTLTLDHVVPQCKGGLDLKTNLVTCCHSCNQSKGHENWKLWYVQQEFYNEDNFDRILEWIRPDKPTNLYSCRPRRNDAS
jgi:hypothetical protein